MIATKDSDKYILTGKKAHKSGPTITIPNKMPVHLAHKGNWTPLI